ncbi:hypothetical protein R9C00_02655 [Flammeovirgaceae bacterium SG7u.111]|nr:hypothetical protein [Flammeovirgaceae bacterium SG7u.132]WPO36340.1 hypothetical protein R9C00_02655 [Flammeovirgaceae bacterium SG7u.111]
MNCPSCNAVLSGENINIQTDLAHCPGCNHIFKISDAVVSDVATGFDINNPPKGAWIRKDMDQMVVGATTRSPMAFFLVPFMCI